MTIISQQKMTEMSHRKKRSGASRLC